MMNRHGDGDSDVYGFEVEDVTLQQQHYPQHQLQPRSLTKIQHAAPAAINCLDKHHVLSSKGWDDKNVLDDDEEDEEENDDEVDDTYADLEDHIIVNSKSQYVNIEQPSYEVAYHPEKAAAAESFYLPLPSRQPDRTASLVETSSMKQAMDSVAPLVPPHAFVARGDALPRPSSPTLNMRPYHAPSRDEDDEREHRLKYNNNNHHHQNNSPPTFHPALKAAVCAEGQEAVWREDMYSDVTSVVMAPPTPVQQQTLHQTKDSVVNKPRRKSLLPFHLPRRMSRKKKNDVQVQTAETAQSTAATPTPLRMHVKTNKIKKSVVLLPQEQDGNAGQESIHVNQARRQEAATAHMIQARQLLNQALVLDQSSSSSDGSHVEKNAMATRRESEELAKVAFEHATAARRIMMVGDATEVEEKAPNLEMDCKNNNDKANNLDEVLSCLAEKGQEAAIHHQRIVLSMSDGDDVDDNGSESEVDFENDTPIAGMMKEERNGQTLKKGFLSEYASRAVHYLESILPKKIISDQQDNLHAALSDDFWSDAGISTLGMKNDTFEYFLSSDDPSQRHSELNTDLMSLSSLNEILDGPNEESDEAVAATSPRAALPVIDVPTRRKPIKSHQKYQTPRRARGLLGLVSPLSTKSILKSNKNGKNLAVVSTIPEDQSVGGTSQESQRSRRGNRSEGDFRATKDSTDMLFVTEEEFLHPIEMDDNSEPTPQEDDDQSEAFVLQEIVNTEINRLMSPGNKSIGSEYNFPTRDIDKYKSIYSNKGSSQQMPFEEGTSDMNCTAIPEEAEWEEEVYERNIQVVLLADKPISADNKNVPERVSQVLIAPTNDDWDDGYDPQSNTAEPRLPNEPSSSVEPVGKTPEYQPSSAPTPLPRHTLPEQKYKEDEQCKKEKVMDKIDQSDCSSSAQRCFIQRVKEKSVVSSPAASRQTKDTTEKSIGSKTRIFGRIVGMLGRRDPLVPTAVVEETYIVRKGASKAEKVTADKAQEAMIGKMVPDREQTSRNQKLSQSGLSSAKLLCDGRSTPKMVASTTKQLRKPLNKVQGVTDDNTAVVEKAITHGNLKAIQSNEEEDDTPANYLEIMLKKKVKEERRKARQQQKEGAECDNRSEPDSYVEKIRGGGRHQEVPGLALEEAASRDVARDPDDKDTRLRNLAPTPRRAKTSTVKMELEASTMEDHDPPMDDDPRRSEEKERRRVITERLYAAGNSSLQTDEEAKCEVQPTMDDIGIEEKVEQVDHGELMMAPTVESAESYDRSTDNVDDNTEAKSQTVISNKNKKSNIFDRSRRTTLSFLPGIRKVHI